MSQLQQAITNIVDVFTEYADTTTDDQVVCKAKLKAQLQKEIQSDEFKVGRSKFNCMSLALHVHAGLALITCFFSGHDKYGRPRPGHGKAG